MLSMTKKEFCKVLSRLGFIAKYFGGTGFPTCAARMAKP
jgi:hypothetical protein